MGKKMKVSLFVTSVAIFAFSTVVPVLAQDVPTIEFSYFVGFSDIATAFGTAIKWGVFLALLVAGIYLLWAGFKYVTSGDDPKNAEAARTQMANAVIGVVIVASVYLMLKVLTMIIPGLNNILAI
ncbi:hypothetical protein KJ596_00690 [Patescibacteria group bacterium]|nr:hypothetical protein [Patescibacteria group bacterium]MBU1868817.1 hypothetical protein [Patescibacteria group bacterium]